MRRKKIMKEKQDRDVRKSERRPIELKGSLGCRCEEIETQSKRERHPMELEGSLRCRQKENETQNKRVHNSRWKYKRTR